MRKLFSFLFLLILIGVIASPAITGYFSRSKHEDFWRQAAEKTSSTLQVLETKVGFLSSTSKLRFNPSGKLMAEFMEGFNGSAASDTEPPSLTIESKMFHGLVPFQAPTGGDPSLAKIRSTINFTLEGQNFDLPGYLDTTYDLMGGTNFRYQVDQGSKEVNLGLKSAMVDWGTLNLNIDMSRDEKKVTSNGRFDGVTANFDDSEFGIGKTTLELDQSKSKYDLWTGKATYLIDRIYGKENGFDQALFELSQINMTGIADIDNELFSYDLSMGASDLDIAEAQDMSFDMSMLVKNLHAPSLKKLQDAGRKMQSGAGAGDMTALNDVMQSVNTLFSQGPSVQLEKFLFKTPAGDVEANANFSLPPSDGGLNPFTVMMEVKGNASIKIPRILAHRMAERAGQGGQLTMLIDQGFLIATGDVYVIEAEYENAQLFVNNREIPVPFGGPTGF
ncbi:MAG: DUF945 family protein [Gammaproteobacteria bacterium]|nr:DUF945 family protein [Gammaproteobacteria bacterium]